MAEWALNPSNVRALGATRAGERVIRTHWECSACAARAAAVLAAELFRERGEAETNANEPPSETEGLDQFFTVLRKDLPSTVTDVDTLLDKFCDFQDTLKSRDYTRSQIELTVKANCPLLLVPIADVHFGNVNTDTRRFLEDMALIAARSHVKTLLVGDLSEGGVLPQMMDLLLEQVIPPKTQRQLLWELFSRTVPNCLGIITGQHDDWPKKTADFEWLEWFADVHDVHYMGWGGCIRLTVGTQEWKILARHCYRFNSAMNATNSVKQMMRMGPFGFGDVGIVADKHEYAYEECELGGQPTALMRPGSYKPSDGYTEQKGFNPSRPYMPGILLWPDRRLFKGSSDWRKLLPEADAMRAGKLDWRTYPASEDADGKEKT
jgi:hypothetical protein